MRKFAFKWNGSKDQEPTVFYSSLLKAIEHVNVRINPEQNSLTLYTHDIDHQQNYVRRAIANGRIVHSVSQYAKIFQEKEYAQLSSQGKLINQIMAIYSLIDFNRSEPQWVENIIIPELSPLLNQLDPDTSAEYISTILTTDFVGPSKETEELLINNIIGLVFKCTNHTNEDRMKFVVYANSIMRYDNYDITKWKFRFYQLLIQYFMDQNKKDEDSRNNQHHISYIIYRVICNCELMNLPYHVKLLMQFAFEMSTPVWNEIHCMMRNTNEKSKMNILQAAVIQKNYELAFIMMIPCGLQVSDLEYCPISFRFRLWKERKFNHKNYPPISKWKMPL